ncbi:MAG: glycosyltransferase family 4 protein [Pseudomonadota bacterium]
MKIAILDPWCFTPPYNRELCKGLASVGHDVTLIGQDAGDDGGEHGESTLTTLPLFKAPSESLPRPVQLLLKGFRHIQGLMRSLGALRRMQPDVIHFQWLALPLIDALFLPLFRRIAPVVLTVHDSNPYNGAGPLLLRLGNRLATRRFNRWIVHNDLSVRRLTDQGLSSERLHQVPHGLLGQAAPTPKTASTMKDGRLHFVQFGKLREYKGVDVLLNALGRLSTDQRERCRVSIVGRPYLDTAPLLDLMERHQLQSIVDLRFDFVRDDEMVALFDSADMLVFPYRGIDTSGVLMAAIARGIPVIASDIGCFAEMLVDGEQGRLVKPDDPEALATALADLISDPTKVEAMRDRMIHLLERIPSWQRIAEMTTEVYELAQLPPTGTTVSAAT